MSELDRAPKQTRVRGGRGLEQKCPEGRLSGKTGEALLGVSYSGSSRLIL